MSEELKYSIISIKELPKFPPPTKKGKWSDLFNQIAKGKAILLNSTEKVLVNMRQSLRNFKNKDMFKDLEIRSMKTDDGLKIYLFRAKEYQDLFKE